MLHISWQRQDASGTWTTASSEGMVRGGALIFPNAREHHVSRYACSSGSETSQRMIVRLVVYEPLTVAVNPNPLVRNYLTYLKFKAF
jgi:hypothetical protein